MDKSVIIAESSPGIANEIGKIFVSEGFRVLGTFNDGLSALRCAKTHPVAIVTLDLILPRLSGIQLASALGKLEMPPAIIAISAVKTRPRLAQAKEAGVRYYILKAFAQERLRAIVGELSAEGQIRQAG